MVDFNVKITMSKKEFLLLSIFVSFSHSLIKIITTAGLIAIIISIFQIIISKNVSSLLLLGIILLLPFLLILLKAGSLYDKSGELSKEVTYYFNDSHFKIIGNESIDSITWDRIIKIINVKSYLIIFTGIHSAKLINVKYITEEQKKFILQKGIKN